MQVSYNWLKDYVNLDDISPETLAEKITNAGIEVEHVHYFNKGIKNVVVGHVVSCEKHPEADKLNLCQVDLGEETVQIVCGASNVAAGQNVPVAKVGSRLPGGLKIKRSKLRGEVSNGMICSLSELGIDQKLVPKAVADGIYVMENEAMPGTDALPYLNLDDAVLELDILPSSAHCMNMIGVAYEVGAILNREIHLPEPSIKETDVPTRSKITVKVDDGSAVPYYGARVADGIEIAPSPQWMQNRLMAAGVRPINNIVDITNYVMLEYGQPLHAFDYDTFGSDEVIVRHARENEVMTTLDDEERHLIPSDIVITNGKEPVAIAGVMGGANSEVTDTTQSILLEAALFDGRSVRRTSSRLQLRTDASARYEKGIDPERVAGAANRACQLFQEIAHARVFKDIVSEDNRNDDPAVISVSPTKINQVLGTDLSANDMIAIFKRLRFKVTGNNDQLEVRVPMRRPDVTIIEDLVEEVGRMYGYNHVPATLPKGVSQPGGLTSYQNKIRKIKRFLEGAGLFEAVTYALTTPEKSKSLMIENHDTEPVMLAMPMSEDRKALRMSLVPSLLEVEQYHVNRQMADIAFFEVGKVFYPPLETQDLPKESENVSLVMTGKQRPENWKEKAVAIDFYTLKGLIEALLEMVGTEETVTFSKSVHSDLHPGRSADLTYKGKVIGYLGALHPSLQKALDLPETYVAELNLSELLHADKRPVSYSELPMFPAVTRDIALVVDQATAAGDLRRVISETGGSLLQEIELFDVYEGEHLDSGKKSLAFSLKYRNPEKTMTEDEVLTIHEQILSKVKEAFDAVLRG